MADPIEIPDVVRALVAERDALRAALARAGEHERRSLDQTNRLFLELLEARRVHDALRRRLIAVLGEGMVVTGPALNLEWSTSIANQPVRLVTDLRNLT